MTIILHSFQIAFESRLLFKRDCFGYNKAKTQINCMQMSQGWENRIQAESTSDLLGDSTTVSSTTSSDVFHNSCKLYAACGVWQCLNTKQFNISQNIKHSPIFSSHKKILYSLVLLVFAIISYLKVSDWNRKTHMLYEACLERFFSRGMQKLVWIFVTKFV